MKGRATVAEPFAAEVAVPDLEQAIRERLEELRRRADLVAIGLEDAVDALIAVFQLHVPITDGPGLDLVCSDCNDWTGATAHYPCPTIRAMASQLGIEVAGA